MRKIKMSEDAYCDIEEMFSYIFQTILPPQTVASTDP